MLDDPTTVAPLLHGDLDDYDSEMPQPDLDLDKSWHGMHYLLTGTAWEIRDWAGAAILGGDEIGEDGGYGPPRLVDVETVKTIAAALEALDAETLRATFDPDAMMTADIYPDWVAGADQLDGYLMPHFAELRRFLPDCGGKRPGGTARHHLRGRLIYTFCASRCLARLGWLRRLSVC
ncbi:hypothetical protein GCM10009682_05860 [Luedemannella flava]|uniref:DinB-like domain-containing protein n=1 Tax=Luedemannella flava TaxID=349316 RepID=A0ABN2LGA6_9ACTN